MESRERWRLLVLGVLGGLLVFMWVPTAPAAPGVLEVRFLDVGQGDAIHIVTPDGVEALIDGGATAGVLREFAQGRSLFDRQLEVMIATHPDTDHVGGLVDVLARYRVEQIFKSGAKSTSPAAVAFATAAEQEGTTLQELRAGQTVRLGALTTLQVFAPVADPNEWPSNAASIIVQLRYGEVEFLLTGDAGVGTERFLVERHGDSLESEVLKLGHHGSDTSTSEELLAAARPQFAVVSAGAENRYGHPHPSVIERVEARGIPILSTAEIGTITFRSDGVRVWQED